MIKTYIFISIVLVTCICLTDAQADMVDLTTADSSGSINGAYFEWVDASSTGTGLIQSFVRLQEKGNEQGYNTDYRDVQYNELTAATFTHSLSLSSIPVVNIDGTDYLEFLLDINENKGGDSEYLSLDELEIYTAATGNLTGYGTAAWTAATTMVYDMDGGIGGDSWIKMNYALNAGSGSGDMFAYIPESAFTGGPYVYLYSAFGLQGGQWISDAGPEEWAVRMIVPVPAPAAWLIGVLGLGVTGLKLRKFA